MKPTPYTEAAQRKMLEHLTANAPGAVLRHIDDIIAAACRAELMPVFYLLSIPGRRSNRVAACKAEIVRRIRAEIYRNGLSNEYALRHAEMNGHWKPLSYPIVSAVLAYGNHTSALLAERRTKDAVAT